MTESEQGLMNIIEQQQNGIKMMVAYAEQTESSSFEAFEIKRFGKTIVSNTNDCLIHWGKEREIYG